MKPTHEHDCRACTFLGTFNGHDLYHCTQRTTLPTVIARYGSGGGEYASGAAIAAGVPLSDATSEPADELLRSLRVAHLLARDTGLRLGRVG